MEIFGFYDTAFHINRALSLESILAPLLILKRLDHMACK